jgi:hypothetical protein
MRRALIVRLLLLGGADAADAADAWNVKRALRTHHRAFSPVLHGLAVEDAGSRSNTAGEAPAMHFAYLCHSTAKDTPSHRVCYEFLASVFSMVLVATPSALITVHAIGNAGCKSCAVESAKQLEKLHASMEIVWYDIDQLSIEANKAIINAGGKVADFQSDKFTSSVFIKLFAPVMKSFSTLKKIVFVDSDTFFLQDAGKLWALFAGFTSTAVMGLAAEQDQLSRLERTSEGPRKHRTRVYRLKTYGQGWYTTAAGAAPSGCAPARGTSTTSTIRGAHAGKRWTWTDGLLKYREKMIVNSCAFPFFKPTGLNTGVVMLDVERIQAIPTADYLDRLIKAMNQYGSRCVGLRVNQLIAMNLDPLIIPILTCAIHPFTSCTWILCS